MKINVFSFATGLQKIPAIATRTQTGGTTLVDIWYKESS